MNDPRYATVPLDMIVRDAASRVAHLVGDVADSATQQKRIAELEQEAADAKQQAAQATEIAQEAINTGLASVSSSSNRSELIDASTIMNSTSRPPLPTIPSSIQCTSRQVGQGAYATVRTNCN